MTNIMAQLEALDNKDWQQLFSAMEKDSRIQVAGMEIDLQYRYIGEIDCPTEMYHDFATVKDVNGKGKTNWFVCSDGSYFTCDDATVDVLFDSGKVVDYEFPFEEERMERYEQLSKDEKISFRMALQGISESIAKEIVCEELGVSAYSNVYVFDISETQVDSSDMSEEIKTYTENIEADNESEAREKLDLRLFDIGTVICSGKRFTAEDNIKMRESGKIFGYEGGTPYAITIKDRNIVLKEVSKIFTPDQCNTYTPCYFEDER